VGSVTPATTTGTVGDPAIGWIENFKLYMNDCHRYPVNIFVINMRNSLFRLFILFDVFEELELIYSNNKFVAPFKFSPPPYASKPNPPLNR